MREIVLDTESTGLSPKDGHRLVEIGCVEIVNLMPTGQSFHRYLNPERDVPEEAAAVHGLREAFLADKPVFAEVVGDFLDFIGDAQLVIHNAAFDMGFLNAELQRAGFQPLPLERAFDTVIMARKRFPGLKNSLDALCDRFSVDKSARTFHGALLDAQLLAEVYLELRGGRQPSLTIAAETQLDPTQQDTGQTVERRYRPPREHAPSAEELLAHAAAIGTIKQPLWKEQ
jgi:DNA polymerase III subunit epsilon